jgi:hypothetical protein
MENMLDKSTNGGYYIYVNSSIYSKGEGAMTTISTPQVTSIAQIRALHDRLIKAEALVANNKVHPVYGLANHYFVEGSHDRYLVNGECVCPDATNRIELIKGLCKHRLAAMVYAEQADQPQTKAESPTDSGLEQKIADLFR